jgi:hypothetical protein
VSVYDLARRELVAERRVREGERSTGSFGILVEGETLYVGDREGRRILVYDLETLGPPRVLATDHDEPDGLAWSPLRLAVFDP